MPILSKLGVSKQAFRQDTPQSLSTLPLFQEQARLTVEPVPPDLAITQNRYFFVVVEGDRRWTFPIQWSKREAWKLFPLLQKFDWTLCEIKEDDKEIKDCPKEIDLIYSFVESLLAEVGAR